MSQARQTPHDSVASERPPVGLVTLGSCHLDAPGKELPPGLESGRPFALLVYLALKGHAGATRDELADLLWGDRDLRSARRVLRQALYVIRRGLGKAALLTEGDRVRLQAPLAVDVRDFEDAVRRGDAAEALRLHSGPFLHGLEVAGARTFHVWVDQERARLLGMLREATLATVTQDAEAARWDEALGHLDRYLSQVHQDPVVLSLKAEVLDVAGRTMEASALARDLLAWFANEPDIAPPLQTREGLRRLTESERGGHSPASTQDSDGLRSPAFTGRGEEYRVLREQWLAARTGEGRVALVVGDPGIGKTRLIEELLRVAASDGATILRGKSYELEDGLLFGALVDVMAQALKAPGFAAVSDVWLAELARLLPELVEQYPRLSGAQEPDERAGRRRFHEAVAQVLEALAYEAPVICVLDDLHWADEATLELVHYLARRLCAAPVLLVTGLRPREASETLRRLQRVLVEEHGGVSLELGPLGRQPMADLVQSMGHGHAPPADIERTVWEASGGNPFLAVSTVRALVDRGAVSVSVEGWQQPERGTDPAGVPQVWELVRERMADLPPQTRELLELAAIVGRGFTAELLGRAAGQDPDSARTHLEALEGSRILKADRTNGVTHFDFAHDRLREAVYAGIDPVRKTTLHALAAQALAGEGGLNACLMARHSHQAGDRDAAYGHALSGAAWARGVFAYGGELEMLDLALANAPDPEARAVVESRLVQLRARTSVAPSEPTRGAERPLRPTRLRWGSAAAAVLVLSTGWIALRGGAVEADAVLSALPEGLLVAVGEGGSSRYMIVNPDQAKQRPQELTAQQLSVVSGVPPGAIVPAPDLSRVAFPLLDGQPPDVWIQERDGGGLRQLTADPEDDVPASWLVDGSGVLIRTIRGRSGNTYGYGLALVALDGAVRMVTRGPWSEKAAEVSPDGSRIAVIRELMGTSLWIMDLDGSDGRQILAGMGEVTRVAWSPDGTALAYHELGPFGGRIGVVELADARASPRTVADGAVAGPVWGPDGETLYFAALADENREIFSVSCDGDALHRLTHTPEDEYPVAFVAPPPARAATVEILGTAGQAGLNILSGDSIAVSAVTWSDSGDLMPALEPELRCLDRSICRIADGSRLLALAPGDTWLVADLGGWRADTVAVRILDGTPSMELEESFEGGIDRQRWRAIGDPPPYVGKGLGRDGSVGFVGNGDAKFGSGVVSVASFAWRRGLAVEFWARGAFDTGWPSFQGWDVFLAPAPPAPGEGDVATESIVTAQVGNGGADRRPMLRFQGAQVEPLAGWDPGAWHHYGIQLLPDARCELWVDGARQRVTSCLPPRSDRVWVALTGRATHAPVVHDDVRVWTGVRWR